MQLGKKKKIKLTALYVETTTVNFSAYVWPFRLSRLFPTYVRTYTYVCVKLFFYTKDSDCTCHSYYWELTCL